VTRRSGVAHLRKGLHAAAAGAAAFSLGCGSHASRTTHADAVGVSAASPFAACASRAAFENAEVEPSLAADPSDPRRLVAVWQQDRYREGGGARGAVVAVSKDGGKSWSQSALPVTACAGADARQAPFASDPWVSVGPDGRIYVAALSDAVAVVTSTDWGASWSEPATVRGPGLTDKESITADPYRPGTAYLVWSDYRNTNPPGEESDELFSVTHDGGRTWSKPQVVVPHGVRAGAGCGQILVDPRRPGRLYLLISWIREGFATPKRPAWMMISRSEDGGRHWTATRRFAEGTPAPQAPEAIIRASPQIPSFAIDAAGTLYGAWQDSRFSLGARNDIVFTRSTDHAAHWTRPRRIATGGLIPTVGAAGRGRVAVQYLALSGETQTLDARYRAVVSADGGEHFTSTAVSRPFPVTEAPQLTSSPLVPGGYFLGDYMGVAPLGEAGFGMVFVPASGDEANKTDVLYRRVS
jgi:hypothetical protein